MNEESPDYQVINRENGKFMPGVSGNPNGRPVGSISAITRVKQIFTENPEEFEDFVREYIKDPGNRKHIVEMLDGSPKGSGAQVAVQINNYDNSPETLELEAIELLEGRGYEVKKM